MDELKKDNKEEKGTTDKFKVFTENGLLNIGIVEEIPLMEYLEYKDEYGLDSMPISMFFMDGLNYLTSTLVPQHVWVYIDNNKTYYVTHTRLKTKIIESIKGEEFIEEILLNIAIDDNTFSLVKSMHDLSMSTIKCLSYPCEGEHMQGFALDRIEAFNILREFIKRIGNIKELDKIINVYDLYFGTNIINEKNFHPIIGDDVITLSKPCINPVYDVNKEREECFDIVLNDTREVVGDIDFRLYEDNFIYPDKTVRYTGNVSYEIKPKYRRNHYATHALKLLVELIRKNTCSVDKNLYISTLPDNFNSQRVALNNGASLYYEGKVPDKELLNYMDGVKEVKIYKINM